MAHCRNYSSDASDDDERNMNSDHSNNKQNKTNNQRRYFEGRPFDTMPIPSAPAGLKAMYTACRKIYPEQPNPLQVTAIVKYWFGGPDPLDYVSMYRNNGDPKRNIPPHWHYISFGLSDLHGDGRVHKISGPASPSGYGFELTFRLKMDVIHSMEPPLWPATLLQSLARYIFSSGNMFCVGDHIPWRAALDGGSSIIQNMAIAADPCLEPMVTEFGTVNFYQVVGVLKEELKAIQWWNGVSVLDLMKTVPQSGGEWLVTDMNRHESVFDLDPSLRDTLNEGILNDGSNLSGVTGTCCWRHPKQPFQSFPPGFPINLSASISMGFQMPPGHDEDPENLTNHNSVHITLDISSARLLHLAIKGRLKHGRHFTYKDVMNNSAVTLVTESVNGAFVSEDEPFVSRKNWLQVLLDDNFIEDILEKCTILNRLRVVDLPHTVSWLSRGLTITVVNG